jgi:hypothetical protein
MQAKRRDYRCERRCGETDLILTYHSGAELPCDQPGDSEAPDRAAAT